MEITALYAADKKVQIKTTFDTVKILSFIFAIYFFELATIPCLDTAECDSFAQQTIVQTADHSDHLHTDEICSPFCACSCCGCQGFSIPTVHQCNTTFAFIEKTTPLYKSFFIDDFIAKIWQPPKIS